MTAEQGSAQQFAKGRPVIGLDELLEARSQAHVTENLYVVAEGSNSDRLSRNLPQRFTKLVPKLKARRSLLIGVPRAARSTASSRSM